jgi:cobalamin biosynthesis Mg chelatase CobN
MNRLVLTCLCALALTAPAQAQSPQVDPDTPAGAEYQLPVDRAREQARERTGAAGAATGRDRPGAAPLFGSGVEERTPPARKKPSSRGRETSSGSHEPTTTTTTRVEQPDLGAGRPEVHALARAPDDGGAGMLTIGSLTVGVLLIGALAGLLWRRRAGP